MTTTHDAPAGFGVSVTFADEQATLGVQGELDLATAPALGAFLDAIIASGCSSVVVDLGELDFADLAGIRVIAYAASRVAASGGALTVRSPSAMVAKIFDIAQLDKLIRLERPSAVRSHLGPEQAADSPGTLFRRESEPSVHGLRRVASIPADNDVVDGALRLVVALAHSIVGGADGVSVSLRRHGHLSTVAASDQTISDMDANQYATGEGPCVDASVEGRWFHAESLETETRWPAFTPRARALGIKAILSSPLLADDRPLGALNIYSRTDAAFAPKDQELAAMFATEASSILTSAGVGVSEGQVAERFSEALRVRRTIAQAEGVIMERQGIGEDGAYTVLRSSSQMSNRPLRDRAGEIVASTHRSQSDLGAGAAEGEHD